MGTQSYVMKSGKMVADASKRERIVRRAALELRDGFYVNPGGNYRLGGQAGASFGRYEVAARAGILRDMMGGQPMFPFYATLAFSTGW